MNNNAAVSYFIRQYLVWLSNAFIVIDNVFYTVASLLSWNVHGLYNTIVSRIVYIGIDDDIRVAADSIRGDKNKLVLLLLLIAIVTIIYLNTIAAFLYIRAHVFACYSLLFLSTFSFIPSVSNIYYTVHDINYFYMKRTSCTCSFLPSARTHFARAKPSKL